jgi:hypothetical protein
MPAIVSLLIQLIMGRGSPSDKKKPKLVELKDRSTVFIKRRELNPSLKIFEPRLHRQWVPFL